MDREDAGMKETTKTTEKTQEGPDGSMKVTVSKNGPYIVTGGVPLIVAEICNDNEGYSGTDGNHVQHLQVFPLRAMVRVSVTQCHYPYVYCIL